MGVTWPVDVPRECGRCAFYIPINAHSPAYGECVRHAPVIRYDRHNNTPDLGRFPLMPTNGWCGEGEVSIRVTRTP